MPTLPTLVPFQTQIQLIDTTNAKNAPPLLNGYTILTYIFSLSPLPYLSLSRLFLVSSSHVHLPSPTWKFCIPTLYSSYIIITFSASFLACATWSHPNDCWSLHTWHHHCHMSQHDYNMMTDWRVVGSPLSTYFLLLPFAINRVSSLALNIHLDFSPSLHSLHLQTSGTIYWVR